MIEEKNITTAKRAFLTSTDPRGDKWIYMWENVAEVFCRDLIISKTDRELIPFLLSIGIIFVPLVIIDPSGRQVNSAASHDYDNNRWL